MSEQEPRMFSEVERRSMELRIVHDARLVQGGARINEFGRLVLTEYQITALHAGEDAQDPLELWLATGVMEAYRAYSVKSRRAPHALLRNGLNTIRDVLVAGRERVGDFRTIGEGSIDDISGMLANDFGITWSERPTMAEIRAICNDLSQVNAIVLDLPIRPGHMVQEVLDASADRRKDLLEYVWPERTEAGTAQQVQTVYESATAFALAFQGSGGRGE